MKFTDGFWQIRPGIEPLYGREAYDICADGEHRLQVFATTGVVAKRGDTLNRPLLTVTLSSPLPDVIGVRIDHHVGGARPQGFDLVGAQDGHGVVVVDETGGSLTSGRLSARVAPGAPFGITFEAEGRTIVSAGDKSIANMRVRPDAQLDGVPVGNAREGTVRAAPSAYTLQQLSLGVGELVYGLGERFGPLVKNGQTVDIWNADGGTSSEQAYKNVPFHLTNRGYGVLVNDTGHVSYEVGSEAVERVQFSVPGESLEYFVVYGGTPSGVLERYTELVGRPAQVPAWSYGLWLSTSFTTDYDEATVTRFVDEMAARELPVSVFHFDCFWMREFNWCDFEWDPRTFPDPDGMLARLHDKGLRVCVWLNPYIGQRSKLFAEAAERGYLVKRADGSVWQWDLWQAGMGLVDFTNPDATRWYQDHLRALVAQGVDCFKTDFGERIPLEVEYFDGTAPDRMHNRYAQLYNEAVFEVLEQARGAGDAVVFARSATAGGQRLPVHWGGDSTSTYESMAETLRGGLSLAYSGFSFWSHDIGGFEGTPDAGVFKRWVAFGLLGTHSRFHGSGSYRVPWAFDEEAVDVTRVFTKLKLSLMPYLYQQGLEASATGVPVMRPTALEFPDDPGAAYLDRQYLLGPSLLVAPVFSESGEVEFYLPAGRWTNWWTGEVVASQGSWRREQHGFGTVPLYVREGTVLPIGADTTRPDSDYFDGLELRVFPGATDASAATVTAPDGRSARFTVSGETVVADGDAGSAWRAVFV